MKMSSMRYILPEPFISMKRNPLMSLAAIITVVITLSLCGIFYLLIMNIDANATMMESAVEIKVFIEDDIDQAAMDELSAAVKDLPGVLEVRYVSREDGLASMAGKFGDSSEIVKAVDENPLPNSYTVKADDPDKVIPIAKAVEKMDHVQVVRYGQGAVENLFSMLAWIRTIGLGIMVLLSLSAVILIALNIRLTVFARRAELQVMKYVGASNTFIVLPFILEGILLSFIGAAIAVGLVLWSYNSILAYMMESLLFLSFVDVGTVMLPVTVGMLGGGIVLGAIGSAIAVRRFVRV
ncbi:MAG: permease-like cell division protein FtsX [Clostridia bacterium]|nr:permease-like cell division protein FtsX [Clostridia bacterium]